MELGLADSNQLNRGTPGSTKIHVIILSLVIAKKARKFSATFSAVPGLKNHNIQYLCDFYDFLNVHYRNVLLLTFNSPTYDYITLIVVSLIQIANKNQLAINLGINGNAHTNLNKNIKTPVNFTDY